MRLQCPRWARSSVIATRRLVRSVPDCGSRTITFATGAHNIIVADSVSAGVVNHLDGSFRSSCNQYPRDSCRARCSDTNSGNFLVAVCRCSSSQGIPSVELCSPVSSVGGQCKLLGGSKEISHREIETQRECIFRGSNPMEANTSGSREIRLIIAIFAAVVQKH